MTRLNVSQAKEQIRSDSAIQPRLFELLAQRGLDIPCWKCKDGFMIHGSEAQARIVSRVVDENFFPAAASNPVLPNAANDDEKMHITGVFGNATRRFNVEPLRPAFFAAAVDRPPTNVPYARAEMRWAA